EEQALRQLRHLQHAGLLRIELRAAHLSVLTAGWVPNIARLFNPQPATKRRIRMQRSMGHELSLDFLHVVEAAAISAARSMGQGKRKYSDKLAVEAMREALKTVPINGEIVIGEGERDKAPMLFIGERVGEGAESQDKKYPEVDIAVDPLEGTNLCATGS